MKKNPIKWPCVLCGSSATKRARGIPVCEEHFEVYKTESNAAGKNGPRKIWGQIQNRYYSLRRRTPA